jgi:hypothetical protein
MRLQDFDPTRTVERSSQARALARGLCRHFSERGFATLTELALPTGRRVDVMALGGRGELVIVEIKTSREDFLGDRKWPEYRDYCDQFLFAVPAGFPAAIVPEDCGLMVADGYGAELVRPAVDAPLNAARRRAQTLRFAHAAGLRLLRLTDPGLENGS